MRPTLTNAITQRHAAHPLIDTISKIYYNYEKGAPLKKRILSLVLATLLTAAMTIPASAAQYVSDSFCDGSYYEIVDNCIGDMFSGTIFCMDRMVYVTATVSYIVDDDYCATLTFAGPSQYGHSTVSNHVNGHLLYVYFKHYIDGIVVRNNGMYRS